MSNKPIATGKPKVVAPAMPAATTSQGSVDPRMLYGFALTSILILATVLRFFHLDFSSLWSDEGNSWAMLERSYAAIAAAAAADIHPPGYYWLLKLWSQAFGTSALAMRSLSAVLGVMLVLVTERIGRRIWEQRRNLPWYPLLAAFLAAVNPLQIFYSQEARMYVLLALAGAGLFWALFVLWDPMSRRDRWAGAGGYVLSGVVGIWTHYSFPILLLAADLAYFVRYLAGRRSRFDGGCSLARFIGLNGIILFAFLPWLPTAIDRVTNWPTGGHQLGLFAGSAVVLQTLLFGPIRALPELVWPWFLAAAILPIFGLIALRREWSGLALGLWLLLPVAMMAGLGLFTDAFVKFLLVASPGWCLLVAAGPLLVPRAWPGVVAVALFAVGTAYAALPHYYQDETARDNYRGISAYLAAVGDPRTDLVLLDAPGQQEVWRYYDPGLPVLGLPQGRPAAKASTEQTLAQAVKDKERVFALFWAMDEADPEAIVETWLDEHAYKALDSWQGNLRFAAYRLAGELEERAMISISFGDTLALVAQAQPKFPQRVVAGDIALVRLVWQAMAPTATRYKVSIQLLDARDQIVAQRDSEPVGGSRPTNTWRPGEQIVDGYGLQVPFGTPPGTYRLQVAVYDPESGERLIQADTTSVLLGEVLVERQREPVPANVVPMMHRLDEPVGPLTLVGYDTYRKGAGHMANTALKPGDMAHFTFYWQAPHPLPVDWPHDLTFKLRLGNQELEAPLAGGSYPTGDWYAGELVRGEFDVEFDGVSATPHLQVSDDRVVLSPLPH